VLFDRVCEGRGEEGEVYDRDELVRRAARELQVEADVALPIVRAVFRATKRILPGKATFDVTSQLPVDIRALWEEA
jgi:uncharacterized protein (DUF2267 family)